jgi:hypothetical protein
MTSDLLTKFKTARAGVALFGVVAMLSLSACTNAGPAPVEPKNEPSSSSSAGIDASSSPSATPAPSEDNDNSTYPAPAVGGKTSAGEPIADAEARFVQGAKKRVENAGSDSKILSMGYETCEFYSESTTDKELFQKLEDASNGDHQTEVNYLYISGAAAKTLCPEYAEFGN